MLNNSLWKIRHAYHSLHHSMLSPKYVTYHQLLFYHSMTLLFFLKQLGRKWYFFAHLSTKSLIFQEDFVFICSTSLVDGTCLALVSTWICGFSPWWYWQSYNLCQSVLLPFHTPLPPPRDGPGRLGTFLISSAIIYWFKYLGIFGFVLFWGYTLWCSGLGLDSVPRDHSWWGLGNHMGAGASNAGQLCAIEAPDSPAPTWFLNLLLDFCFWFFCRKEKLVLFGYAMLAVWSGILSRTLEIRSGNQGDQLKSCHCHLW